ncbi:MAG: DUF58 domain-containing protein [Lachnospiraceae bacterium]|nr:DUF58 domain-containing protein [Lachnospiraceae bacterium]
MKNKVSLIIAGLFVLSLVGISFFGGPITYIFFFSVILVPLLSYIYIMCVIHSVKIYQRTDGRDMVCGTPSDFYITLQNEGWFSFSSLRISFFSSFSGISEIDDGVEYELPPHFSIVKKTKLLCRYRGTYCVGIKQIVVKDYLGLFSVTYKIKEPLSVIVAPAIVHLSKLEGKEIMSDADRDNMLKKTEPDIPVREYVNGDDIRFLNWKASAVMQKYMVRERKGEEKSGVAIIMDSGRYSSSEEIYLPMENTVMEHSLALTLYYVENNIPSDVIYKADHVVNTPVHDMGGFETLYSQMCDFSYQKDYDMCLFGDELRDRGGLFGYRMLIFVVSKLNDQIYDAINEINTDRVPVRIYVACDDTAKEDLKMPDARMEVIVIGSDDGSKEGA